MFKIIIIGCRIIVTIAVVAMVAAIVFWIMLTSNGQNPFQ